MLMGRHHYQQNIVYLLFLPTIQVYIYIPRSAPHTVLAVRDEDGASTKRVSLFKIEQNIYIKLFWLLTYLKK